MLSAVERMDREANWFAMELLMPQDWIISDLSKNAIDIEDDKAIIKLARRYRVSPQLMGFRIGQIFAQQMI